MGKIRLEIMPSYHNIVVAPVIPESTFTKYPDIITKMNFSNNIVDNEPLVDFGFYQLNQKMNNRFSIVGNDAKILDPHTWECNTQTTSNSFIHLAHYKLREAVSEELKADFKNIPLLFPIQTVSATQFSGLLGKVPRIDNTLTTKLVCVNNAYIFFNEDNATSTQRFINPMIDYQLTINGKQYPHEIYRTVDCPRNYSQTLDALNYNGLHNTSAPKDFRTSIQPYTKIRQKDGEVKIVWNTGTRSNFYIAIPFCDTNMFQGGMTTGDTQITMKGYRITDTKMKNHNFDQAFFVATSECFLKIRSEPSIAGGGQIEIVYATIDQLAPQT
jgi:hypothetical protein